MGLKKSYLCRQYPREYSAVARGLQKRRRNESVQRFARLQTFVIDLVQRDSHRRHTTTATEVKEKMPVGCTKNEYAIKAALKAAREELSKSNGAKSD
jgi:hypothetical protein